MRKLQTLRVLSSSIVLAIAMAAQTPPAQTPSQTQADLRAALVGNWSGVLEYRDYSEPAGSTKRTVLPTWLAITADGPALRWHYIYDDGPTKTVEETDTVTFDVAHSGYTEGSKGMPPLLSTVSGYDTLRAGHGTLILTGSGTDNDKPAETRTTLTIRRNLIDILEEVRPAKSTGPFVFRHSLRFVRAAAPTPNG